MSPLDAARAEIANYDSPRCGEQMVRQRPDGEHVYTCCRSAGHDPEIAHDFGPRFSGVGIHHLRAALAEVDRLRDVLGWTSAQCPGRCGALAGSALADEAAKPAGTAL